MGRGNPCQLFRECGRNRPGCGCCARYGPEWEDRYCSEECYERDNSSRLMRFLADRGINLKDALDAHKLIFDLEETDLRELVGIMGSRQ